MLPRCGVLGITVNELLSGEMLHASYREKGEENLIGLIREKQTQKLSGRNVLILNTIALLVTVMLWLLLFADSNVYQLGQKPTPLTFGYLTVGFMSIYLVLIVMCYGIVKKNAMMLFAALSFASFVCMLICLGYNTFWLVLPAMAGMVLCFLLSLWSAYKLSHH